MNQIEKIRYLRNDNLVYQHIADREIYNERGFDDDYPYPYERGGIIVIMWDGEPKRVRT